MRVTRCAICRLPMVASAANYGVLDWARRFSYRTIEDNCSTLEARKKRA